jgi:predicted outer membrane repeat protein
MNRKKRNRLKLFPIFIFALSILLIYTHVSADDFNVPEQYKTIQAAIDAAKDGDTIIVANGTYTGEGNKDLDFKGKELTVQSATGPEYCIIDCEKAGRGFFFHNGELKDSVVNGFTITNGANMDYGGAICIKGSSPTIKNCIIKNNRVTGTNDKSHGGGIYCDGGGAPTIVNCAIIRNVSNYTGGGIYSDNCDLTVINSTITRNTAADGGGLRCRGEISPKVINTILYGDTPNEVSLFPVNTKEPQVTYSLVQDGYTGKGNLKVDPLFVGNGDFYHLTAKSPCINAGLAKDAPETDIDGEPRGPKGRIDIGADEYK